MKKLCLFAVCVAIATTQTIAQCNVNPVALPYFEGFEIPNTIVPNFPPCTIIESVQPAPGFGPPTWKTEQWMPYAKTGSQYLITNNFAFQVLYDIYFYTPFFSLQANRQYSLKYYCKSTTIEFADGPQITAYIGNAQSSASMTTVLLGLFSLNYTDYQLLQKTFTVPANGNYTIGFRMRSKSSAFPVSDIPVYIDDISLEDMGAIVPVKMGPLKSISNSSQRQLVWQTFTENNNKGFHIETSKDGQQFSSAGFIASLAPQGNSTLPISYTYNLAQNSNIYYRLKQEDKNGSITYSNIVKISAIADKPIISFDPSNKKISSFSSLLQVVKFSLVSTEGKILLQKSIIIPAGYSQLQLDFTSIPKGIYFLQSNFEKGNSPSPIKIIL